MAEIKLSGGEIAIVDDEDFNWLSRWRWKIHTNGYACRSAVINGKHTTILMHRFVINAPIGMEVDHDNENKLDNRKSNLNLLTPLEHGRKHAHRIIALQKARQRYPDRKNCEVCGLDFAVNPRKRKRHKCCSSACAQSMRIAGRMRQAKSS